MTVERPLDDVPRPSALHTLAQPWLDARVIGQDALRIVEALAPRWEEQRPEVLLVLAMTVEAWARGHAGLWLDLARARLQLPMPERDDAPEPPQNPWNTVDDALFAGMSGSPMVAHPGHAEAHRPFATVRPLPGAEGVPPSAPRRPVPPPPVLLQTRRMAWEETAVAEALVALAGRVSTDGGGIVLEDAEVAADVARFFPTRTNGPGARALRIAATRRLTIVTGGPGTGKTWSIKRVLVTLLGAAERRGRALSIVLAAPTGKAAVRMREAMMEDLDQLTQAGVVPAVVQTLRALPASTLHALLRLRPGSEETRFGPDNPLPADVIVVDEASMLDLPLMRKLLRAIGPDSRLLLLGDRDQLPSVDVGSVLSDIVADALRGEGPLAGNVARFEENHRSGQSPALARLVETLQRTASDEANNEAIALLAGHTSVDGDPMLDRLRWLRAPNEGRPTAEQVKALVGPWLQDTLRDPDASRAHGATVTGNHEGYVASLAALLRTGQLRAVAEAQVELLRSFDRYRVLAVHRKGPLGVAGLTRALGAEVRRKLADAWALRPTREGEPDEATRARRLAEGLPRTKGLWLGQPVLVTENAPTVGLYNGDIGLVLPSRLEPRTLVAVFPVVRLDPATGNIQVEAREVPLPRLPPHEDALVLTVHKGQGSQYAHVAVVLADSRSPIQTRELVYTGITRASERVSWLGDEEALRTALQRRVQRGSALAWRLRGER